MGLMDMFSVMTPSAEGEPGMFEQIKNAGESFNRLSADMAEIKAMIKVHDIKLDALLSGKGIKDG